MDKIAIIYDKYYDIQNMKVTIGGVQTYITDLISLCGDIGLDAVVFQYGDYEKVVDNHGCKIQQIELKKFNVECFSKKINQYITDEFRICLYATDVLVPIKNVLPNAMAIQHGIYWDMPRSVSRSDWRLALGKAKDFVNIRKKYKKLLKVVCVDYNFVNWYRSLDYTAVNRDKFLIIPNYTSVNSFAKPVGESINIIFARRLTWYRGTRVFTRVIMRLLSEYENVKVTVAGTGEDEKWMHEMLDKYDNVHFTSYTSNESFDVHKDKHIAVIPTVGSEGTSLSLLEAMSAKCAVVCTSVGGMTNIVIDNYNGIMVEPGNEEQLYEAIAELLDNEAKRKELAKRGYETVKNAFLYEKWKEKWSKILTELCEVTT